MLKNVFKTSIIAPVAKFQKKIIARRDVKKKTKYVIVHVIPVLFERGGVEIWNDQM